MRKILCILFVFVSLPGFGQGEEANLENGVKTFHRWLVEKNTGSISRQTDRALSYGHSNGWVETKSEFLKNLETGYIVYHSFREDSLQVMINGRMAHARFVADINVSFQGKRGTFRLKVLEVWVKKGKRWLLFARQAVKG